MMHKGVHSSSSPNEQKPLGANQLMMLAYCTMLNFHAVPSILPDSHTGPIRTSFDLIVIYVSNCHKNSLPLSLGLCLI